MARSVLSSRRGRRGFLRDRRGTWRHVAALAWQAWHLETCSCTLRGRRGTLRPPPSFHVAGVDLRFTWQAWYSTYSHTQLAHTQLAHIQLTHAGVALGDMDRHFAWQAWHVWHWAGSGGAFGFAGGLLAVLHVASIALHSELSVGY